MATKDITATTTKATPVDADSAPLIDSAASDAVKRVTWANIKATLKTYFDTLYALASHTHAAADVISGTIATARLGSGTADSTTFLRGDQTWGAPSGAGGGTLEDFDEGAAPATPASGKVRIYAKTDGLMYSKDDAGAETLMSGGVGGGGGAFVGAHVSNSAAQSVATTTVTALTFDTEEWDTDAQHSTVTNPSRLTCAVAGKYHIVGHFQLAATQPTTVNFVGFLQLNGATTLARARHWATTLPAFQPSAVVDLGVGDYVELCAFQTSGGSINTVADGPNSWLSMHRIG